MIVKYLIALELQKVAEKCEADRVAAATDAGKSVDTAEFQKGKITATGVNLPGAHMLKNYTKKAMGITERQKFLLDVTREVLNRAARNIQQDDKAWDVTPKRVGNAKRRRPPTPSKQAATSVGDAAGARYGAVAKKAKKSKVAPVVHKLVGLGKRGTGSKYGKHSRCDSCTSRKCAANQLLLPADRAKARELQRGIKRCTSGCHACQTYICTACVYTNGVHANRCPAVLIAGGLNPVHTCKECTSLPCIC